MGRIIAAALFAAVMVGLYAAIIYAFFAYLWPILPPWATMIAFIALAVFAIGSPIFWLLRLGGKAQVPEHLLRRQPPDDDEGHK